jgi:putative transposase
MKRRKRILVEEGEAHYHCISRVVGGERLLGKREKEVMREMLWRVAGFCGVRVRTYALMSNHFHVLVGVPRQEAREIDDAELVGRYRLLYERSRSTWQPTPEVLEALLKEDGAEGRAWRHRLRARMGDVSAFMKTLKQRFSVWYNQTHGRFGTLWSGRFKSLLVENAPRALLTVSAYIDLNPVRAGLVDDPADYRWCGYAEAMGGDGRARAGLSEVSGDRAGRWDSVVAHYRRFLFGKGEAGAVGKGKIARARVLEALKNGGTVPLAEALRCRVRYFTEGAILGSPAFVRASGAAHRRRPSRRGRAEPRPMEGAEWDGLSVLRSGRRAIFH